MNIAGVASKMAKARCERCGIPNERDKRYSTQPYLPVGHPSSGVICGRTTCRNPAFARLTLDDKGQYRKFDHILQTYFKPSSPLYC